MEDAHLALPSLYQQVDEAESKSLGDGENGGGGIDAEGKNKADGDLRNMLVGVYGVFDGHGGSCVSQWVSENFANLLKNEITRFNEMKNNKKVELKNLDAISETQAVVAESLQSAFLKVDEELQRPETEQMLRKINEKARSENQNDSFVDSSSLFKVLLPDRVNNRKQTIRLIEKHTERLLRESFNFQNPNRSEMEAEDDVATNEDEVNNSNTTNGNNHDQEEGIDGEAEPSEADTVMVNDSAEVDENHFQGVEDEKAGSLVTRVVNEDESMKSADCLPEDEFDMEGDLVGDSDSPNLAFGCGSTSVVMVVLGGESPALLVANAGDSRAVLSRGGQAMALSHDHKPQLREEGERIRRAGGSVTNGRVDGNLNLSRSLGDLAFKRDHSLPPAEQRISAMPDVRICPLTAEDEFVVLACDGIWDCKSNQQVIDFVRSRLYEDEDDDMSDKEGRNADDTDRLAKICEELCDECLSSNPSESEGVGCDNMTVIIVQLNKGLVHGANSTAKPIALYGKEVDAYL